MLKKQSSKLLTLAPICVFVALFLVVRLPSILAHQVAFTYDQARDFTVGARIIIDHNMVFTGPTTGIGGLFHGAWWYYITAIIYATTGSAPINYYYAMLAIHVLFFVIMYIFVSRVFGRLEAVVAAVLVTFSPYFIRNNLFLGNNIMAIPSFMMFLISLYYSQGSNPNRIWWIALGLSAGFVAEFELAFGIFLIPLLVVYLAYRYISSGLKLREVALTFAGLVAPFIPRLLFEVKNGFMQTKVLLGFTSKPKLYNPHTFSETLSERIGNFWYYTIDTLGSTGLVIGLALILVAFAALSYRRRKAETELDRTQTFIFTIVYFFIGLFLISLTYKDTFWNYYYEGIQYCFVFALVASLSYLRTRNTRIFFVLAGLVVALMTPQAASSLKGALSPQDAKNGLFVQEKVVDYIYSKNARNTPFCVRNYVPPVIPYTYDYLWLHHYKSRDIPTPRFEYLDGQCYYVLEPDDRGYEFRQKKWLEENVPPGAKKVESTTLYGIEVAKYVMEK